MALGKTVYFKRLTKSAVTLYLEDVEGIMANRWFTMNNKVPRIGVPLNYALSVFSNATLKSMMDRNIFEIENINDLVEAAKEKGFIAPSEEEVKELTKPKKSSEMLLAILKGGSKAKITELLESSDKQRVFDIAKAHIQELQISTIDLIENMTGVGIREE